MNAVNIPLTNLKCFSLAYNKFNSSILIPKNIGKLSKLEVLELQDNDFINTIPSSIQNLTKLNYLNLHSNLLTSTIPSFLGNLTKLSILKNIQVYCSFNIMLYDCYQL